MNTTHDVESIPKCEYTPDVNKSNCEYTLMWINLKDNAHILMNLNVTHTRCDKSNLNNTMMCIKFKKRITHVE